MNGMARRAYGFGGRLMARGSDRLGVLGTTGARSGRRRETALGILRRPDGTVVVAAGGAGRGWAANLRGEPRCTLDVKGRRAAYIAELLGGDARDEAVRDFVAAMGRTAGNTVWTDVFLLRPAADGAARSAAS
jgi:deazaflavin-dependent oxidoreductase (nitroreductase family)